MKILVINAGSSSVKFQLLESQKNFMPLYKGFIDGIETGKCSFTGQFDGQKNRKTLKSINHEQALQYLLNQLVTQHIIQNYKEIAAVGHRVVHGGEQYQKAVLINRKVLTTIKNLCDLAPLHNPPNLKAIETCLQLLPKIPQVAVFDTAFHETLPEKAFLYALPYSLYKKFGIRRYGFHGISHQYVSQEAIKLLSKNHPQKTNRSKSQNKVKNSKIIVCHLGNGSSITAVKNGKSIDTSMGFTPLEGLPMGTRSGDIDPAIIFYLLKKLRTKPQAIEDILVKQSGLRGLSEISSDMRDVWKKYQKKNPQALRTMEVLAYRIAKYIGAYTAALQGLDALVFTGGMGENAFYLREKICAYLDYSGLKIDQKKNQQNLTQIQRQASKVKVFVIPTNEEEQIARETKKVISISHYK